MNQSCITYIYICSIKNNFEKNQNQNQKNKKILLKKSSPI